MFQAVDLAAKFSAVIVRDRSGEVLDQFDSRGISPFAFCAKIARTAKSCEFTLAEGLPYGLDGQNQILPPGRLQGVLMMACNQTIDDFRFIDPARWMREFEGVAPGHYRGKGLSKYQVGKLRVAKMAEHAKERGYEPPNLVAEWQAQNPDLKPLKKYIETYEKNMTDYVAAFLISEFALSYTKEDLFALQGVDFPII